MIETDDEDHADDCAYSSAGNDNENLKIQKWYSHETEKEEKDNTLC